VFEHYHSACGLFVRLICKFALFKQEQFVLLCQEVRHYFDQIVVLVLVDCALTRDAAIHKHIALA
jgi:hypothetical protein